MQGNRSFPRWSLLFTTIGLGLLLAPSARADEGMNLLLFEPAPGTLNYFSTSSSHILEHLQVGGALVFDYSAAPLRLIRGDTREELSRIVEHQAVLHATVGIGLFDRLELAFGL
ncbi:MAG: hypothetical protein FJ125_08955, partial [Deltaproteobacteria bacterium]|nr:hypothetical protein [Deltaproteobacteria bacterium]